MKNKKAVFMIDGYQVELRGIGATAQWCVYTKRTAKRNSGSNLVLQIPASKNGGVSILLSSGQQKKKLTVIIGNKLGGKK